MTYFSGSPLYNYTLALELKKQGHDVSIYSMWSNNRLQIDLLNSKIMTYYNPPTEENGEYDLVLISQPDYEDTLDHIIAKRVVNIVHSEYDVETPITDKRVDYYVVIRPQIKDHLIQTHKIPKGKITLIYNGIDFERFSPDKRKIHNGDYIKVVLPCTLDLLRKKFIEYYARRASERYRVYIYGRDYGNDIDMNEWVYSNNEVFNIEDQIADADFVAGILLGRVNLEARAMGIVSFIHNPEIPEQYEIYYPEEKQFREMHDIKKVAKQLTEV